jgi:hypothetical protein
MNHSIASKAAQALRNYAPEMPLIRSAQRPQLQDERRLVAVQRRTITIKQLEAAKNGECHCIGLADLCAVLSRC